MGQYVEPGCSCCGGTGNLCNTCIRQSCAWLKITDLQAFGDYHPDDFPEDLCEAFLEHMATVGGIQLCYYSTDINHYWATAEDEDSACEGPSFTFGGIDYHIYAQLWLNCGTSTPEWTFSIELFYGDPCGKYSLDPVPEDCNVYKGARTVVAAGRTLNHKMYGTECPDNDPEEPPIGFDGGNPLYVGICACNVYVKWRFEIVEKTVCAVRNPDQGLGQFGHECCVTGIPNCDGICEKLLEWPVDLVLDHDFNYAADTVSNRNCGQGCSGGTEAWDGRHFHLWNRACNGKCGYTPVNIDYYYSDPEFDPPPWGDIPVYFGLGMFECVQDDSVTISGTTYIKVVALDMFVLVVNNGITWKGVHIGSSPVGTYTRLAGTDTTASVTMS